MKVAVSIPDATFANADALAKRMGTSRSTLYARALEDFVARDACDLTEQINAAVDSMTAIDREEQAMWVKAGSRTVLKHTEW
jgi:predicted transcriptional regulator